MAGLAKEHAGMMVDNMSNYPLGIQRPIGDVNMSCKFNNISGFKWVIIL